MPRANATEEIPAPASEPVRLAWVEKHLAEGLRPTACARQAVQEWGISESKAWELVAQVRDRWAKEAIDERPRARAELLAQVDRLLERAHEGADLGVVLRALALKAELYGLRLRAVVLKDERTTLTDEERERLTRSLLEAPRATAGAVDGPR